MSHENRVTYVSPLHAFVNASIQCIPNDHLVPVALGQH